MKGRGKTRIPEAVLAQARAVAKSAPVAERPAPPQSAPAQRTARGQVAGTKASADADAVKRKVVSRLRKLHPMD